jgi:hypothetical protein
MEINSLLRQKVLCLAGGAFDTSDVFQRRLSIAGEHEHLSVWVALRKPPAKAEIVHVVEKIAVSEGPVHP